MKKLFTMIGIVAIIGGFTACKTTKNTQSSQSEVVAAKTADQNITEKYWKLIELNGKAITPEDKMAKEPHMILKTEDNRVNGSGGCNGFFGTYTITQPNRIKFSQMGSTMMACPNMEVESAMLKMFPEVDNYTVSADGKYLSLNKARMAPLARFEVVYLK